jgi:hypothetical protein
MTEYAGYISADPSWMRPAFLYRRRTARFGIRWASDFAGK